MNTITIWGEQITFPTKNNKVTQHFLDVLLPIEQEKSHAPLRHPLRWNLQASYEDHLLSFEPVKNGQVRHVGTRIQCDDTPDAKLAVVTIVILALRDFPKERERIWRKSKANHLVTYNDPVWGTVIGECYYSPVYWNSDDPVPEKVKEIVDRHVSYAPLYAAQSQQKVDNYGWGGATEQLQWVTDMPDFLTSKEMACRSFEHVVKTTYTDTSQTYLYTVTFASEQYPITVPVTVCTADVLYSIDRMISQIDQLKKEKQ